MTPNLDRRVTIHRQTVSNGGTGHSETWGTLGTVWAARTDVSDAEKIAAGGVYGTVAARFVVRSSSISRLIRPADRLVMGGLTFEIVGIKELGRQDYLEITAEARRD